MRKLVSFIVLLSALIVSGCASVRYNKNAFDEKVYANGKNAYIVIGAQTNLSSMDGAFPVYTTLIFESTSGDKYAFKLQDRKTMSFVIKPGSYKLKSYSLYGAKSGGFWGIGYGIYEFQKKDPLFDKLLIRRNGWWSSYHMIQLDFSKVVEGGFSVKEGDVVYLGCVETIITDVNRSSGHKFMSFRPEVGKHVQYETSVKNLLGAIDKEKSEKEAKKAVSVSLLSWQNK